MKKVLSLLLTVALILSAVALPVSAQEVKAFTVSLDTVNATQAQNNVVVPICLNNNPGISGFSFCVDYDTNNLVLVDSEITIDSGYKVIKETSSDGLNIAWTGTDNYTEDGTIAKLYFNITPSADIGTAEIKIKYRIGYDSFYKTEGGEENDINIISQSGGINITKAETNTGLCLAVGNANASMNETDVVVPISIDKNTGISGFSFCVNYDTARLQLNSSEIVLADGYKVINQPAGYNLGLAWTSENRFTNNGVIANLHFSVKDGAVPGKGYINVVFRDGYDSFYKTESGTETDVKCTTINGYIDVADHTYGEWQIVKEATCTETGLKRRSCKDAGCSKIDEVVIPKTAHKYVETVVSPNCTEQGYTIHVCSVCHDTFKDNYTDALSHVPGDWEKALEPGCTTEGQEVQKCTVCHEIINTRCIEATGHSYGEWITYKNATFNEDGESRKYCSKCDAYKSQRIPKLSESHTHDYTGKEEVVSEASCTNEGSKKVYCSEPECGAYITQTIPKTDHEYGEWQITTPATFNTDGVKTRYCIHCSAYETETIPKLSEGHTHDYSGKEEIIKEPSCTEEGSKKIYCLNPDCGEYTVVSIDIIDHIAGEWEITDPATCTKSGTKVKKCTKCGKVLESAIIDMIAHTYVDTVTDPTPSSQGYTTHKCSKCGYSYVDTYVDYEAPHVHDYSGREEIISNATCKAEGSKKVYCTGEDCNEYTIVIIPKADHVSGDWETIEPATCTKSGTRVKKCTVCDKILETEFIEMIPHTFVDTVTDPTPTSQGYTTHKCSMCGYSYVDNYTDYVEENPAQIIVENKSAVRGGNFTVTVKVKNNSGFAYLELTPVYSNELTLVSIDNGELISDLTQGKQYIWVADGDVTDDGILMTFTFTTTENVEPGNYEVGFTMRSCINYNEQNVDISVVKGMIEIVDFAYGDVNGDGSVNGQDVVRLKKYLANYDYDTESSTIEINAGADANGDGLISGQDVVRLIKYLANYDYETETSTIVLGPQN